MVFQVLYTDDYLMVVNKPAGLVVEPAESIKEETLVDILRREYSIRLERAGIVHRLDKDTSGILLVAKTQEALENLQDQFKKRIIKKEYLALAHGLITERGKIDAPISRNPGNREKFTVISAISPGRSQGPPSRWSIASQGDSFEVSGREAVTEYEPVKNLQFTLRGSGQAIDNLQSIFNDFNKIQMRKLEKQHYGEFTLLRCKPKTGRTHQIRVHLKYINHPIVSDEKYVGRKTFRLDKRWCPRMFLHAAKIGFKHPETSEWMEVESKLPEDLRKVLLYE